jgi:hypothetical protein
MIHLFKKLFRRPGVKHVTLTADAMPMFLEGCGGDNLWRALPGDWTAIKNRIHIVNPSDRYICVASFLTWCRINNINPFGK